MIFNPALLLLIALQTAETAFSCPINLLWMFSSKWSNFWLSVSVILEAGIFVQVSITLATSSTPNSTVKFPCDISAICFIKAFSLDFKFAIFSKSGSWFSLSIVSSSSFSSLIASNSFFILASSARTLFVKLSLLQASSIISIALSGKNLSWMYFSDIITILRTISSVTTTLW